MHELCSILLQILESWGVKKSKISGKERLDHDDDDMRGRNEIRGVFEK